MSAFNIFLSLLCLVTLVWGLKKCERDVRFQCPHPGDLFFNFPQNPDELSTRCSEDRANFECLIDYEESCRTHIVDINSTYAALKTLTTFCTRGSTLFKAIADNGKCLRKFFKDNEDNRVAKCVEIIESENKEKYEEIVYFSNDVEDLDREYCFLDIMHLSCFVEAIFADCGKIAKELVLHVLNEFGLNNAICENRMDDGKHFMKALNLSLDPESSMEDFITLLENETELS